MKIVGNIAIALTVVVLLATLESACLSHSLSSKENNAYQRSESSQLTHRTNTQHQHTEQHSASAESEEAKPKNFHDILQNSFYSKSIFSMSYKKKLLKIQKIGRTEEIHKRDVGHELLSDRNMTVDQLRQFRTLLCAREAAPEMLPSEICVNDSRLVNCSEYREAWENLTNKPGLSYTLNVTQQPSSARKQLLQQIEEKINITATCVKNSPSKGAILDFSGANGTHFNFTTNECETIMAELIAQGKVGGNLTPSEVEIVTYCIRLRQQASSTTKPTSKSPNSTDGQASNVTVETPTNGRHDKGQLLVSMVLALTLVSSSI